MGLIYILINSFNRDEIWDLFSFRIMEVVIRNVYYGYRRFFIFYFKKIRLSETYIIGLKSVSFMVSIVSEGQELAVARVWYFDAVPKKVGKRNERPMVKK
jgi:hypothetical protein